VTSYIARRLLQLLPVLLLVSVLVVLMIYLVPGDPAANILGPNALPEQVEALRHQFGLDRPLPVQYGSWLGRVLQGDLGRSFLNAFPVSQLIGLKLPATLTLVAGATAVALLISLPVGALAAVRRRTWVERATFYYMSLAYSIPTFWVGILLILVFSVELRWLPSSGYVSFAESPTLALRHLCMPALTLGTYLSSILARFIKATLAEVLAQDYVRTARAKGLPERQVVYKHALKNAMLPVVTVLGLQFGAFIGGTVVTEAVFNWPGLGTTIWNAVLNRDYSLVQGATLFTTVVFVFVNLLTDLSYALLDPRIRYA